MQLIQHLQTLSCLCFMPAPFPFCFLSCPPYLPSHFHRLQTAPFLSLLFSLSTPPNVWNCHKAVIRTHPAWLGSPGLACPPPVPCPATWAERAAGICLLELECQSISRYLWHIPGAVCAQQNSHSIINSATRPNGTSESSKQTQSQPQRATNGLSEAQHLLPDKGTKVGKYTFPNVRHLCADWSSTDQAAVICHHTASQGSQPAWESSRSGQPLCW